MAQLTSLLSICSKESVKSEPNEIDSSIHMGTHNDNIKGTLDDKKDDILLESDIPASGREICEENEVIELKIESSIKNDVSSQESPYVNIEDDKFTIEESNVTTEESNAELNDASAVIELPRKRGRPRGTFGKKKGKETVKALRAMMTDTNNVTSQQPPRKRGRPLGSLGRKKQNRIIEGLNATMTDANNGASQQVPRRRGRPRKNRDKIASETESETPICYRDFRVTNETDSSVPKVKKTLAENNILSQSDTPICNREISEIIKETHAKRFTCPECHQTFTSNALLEHFPIHDIRNFICVVCHKEFTANNIDFKIHMQQHSTPDNKGRFNCEHCPRSYSDKGGLIRHYRVKHPPKAVVNKKECSENCEPTQQIALVKRELNESDSTITHSKIVRNKMAEDEGDNNLLELENAARYEKFCEENELNELVSSMKSEPPSPESAYVNLEDDKFTVEETDVKAEESSAELDNPSSAIIGRSPGTVDNNDPILLDHDQNQQQKSFKCFECHENYMDAEYTHKRIVSSLSNLQCWICGEGCLSETDLTSHMATHDRAYTCKICGKSFMHLLANETHITHCSQKHMQHSNGNELFWCEICRSKFTTKKNPTENELLTCPDNDFCEVLVNGSMDSVKSEPYSPETLNISQKNNSASFHDVELPKLDDQNMPLSDQEFNVKSELNELVDLAKNEPFSTDIFKNSQKNHSSSSTFPNFNLPKPDAVNRNVFTSDKELSDESNELVKNEPTSPKIFKSSLKSFSLSSTLPHFNIPKSAGGNGNVSVCDKKLSDESNELEMLAKSKQSASEFCKSCQRNNSLSTTFHHFNLQKSDSVNGNVSTSDKELEPFASECCKSCQNNLSLNRHNPSKVALLIIKNNLSSFHDFNLPKLDDRNVPLSGQEFDVKSELEHSSLPSCSADLDNLSLDRHNPSKVALRKMTEKADALGPTSKQSVGNHKITTNHYNVPDYKGPYRCKHCPKKFARKYNLTCHHRVAHPPKNCVKKSSSAAVHNKLLSKFITTKKLLKYDTLPVSNTSGQNVTDSNKSIPESEPSNATIGPKISTVVHSKNLELPILKIPEPEYYKWIMFGDVKQFWENKMKDEVVNSAISEPSSSKSPHYINQENETNSIEEKKENTLEKNEKKIEQTKETKAEYIDSFIQFLATK